jgi:FtsH-binding integral membrane protein
MEQLKPGLFSNSLDITYILVLALTLIILAVMIKPQYSSSRWVKIYYSVWCLALGLVFVKLVKNWLALSFPQALVLVGFILLILILAGYYQIKYRHE